jgi:hypothetical protein
MKMPVNRMLRQRTRIPLPALTLSASTIAEASAENTVVGTVLGLTDSASVASLTDTAGGRFKVVLVGSDYVVKAGATVTDYETATTHNITVRETRFGVHRDTVLAITVTDVVEVTYTTLDPDDTSSTIALTNGNLTATKNGTTGHAFSYGLHGKASGKWYYEATVVNVGSGADGVQIGVGSIQTDERQGLGQARAKGVASHLVTFTTGDVIGVVLDATNNLAWHTKNGVTISGVIDVSGGQDLTTMQKAMYPLVNLYRSGAVVTCNFGTTAFAHTPPAGYAAWSATAAAYTRTNYRTLGIWIRSLGFFAHAIAEFEVRNTSGGATTTGGATAFATGSGAGAAANAIDGLTTTYWGNVGPIGQDQDPVQYGVDWGAVAGRSTGFLAIRSRDGGGGGETQAPTRFVAFVGDGTNETWKLKGFTAAAWPGTTPGAIREFALP